MTHLELSKTSLGIELGSTKIKAVLIDGEYRPVASGSHDWASTCENGLWTYQLDEVFAGLRDCFCKLAQEVRTRYDVPLETVGCIGVSAMMHGYLPFDRDGELLTHFRTWQNTNTGRAAAELSEAFSFNVPQRWSISHLYQAILDREPHVDKLRYLNTLSGYVHYMLTGQRVLGINDASGMFPIDSETKDYDENMLRKWKALSAAHGFAPELRELLPRVLSAGQSAGCLSVAGAMLLDPTGTLKPGIPMCPPEGDAGTGMVATNSITPRTGNVSAGTSIFSMVVLERALSGYYPEIDMVTTPTGAPVAMVHCNNCTSDMNAWCGFLGDFCGLMGKPADMDDIYPTFYQTAARGEADCGGLVVCNFIAAEPVVSVGRGFPLLLRLPDSRFTPENFFRANIYSALTGLKLGMDILARENVTFDRLTGHGGLFRHAGVGATFLAAATGTPVCTMKTAAVGGAYGMALLAACASQALPLERFLQEKVFADTEVTLTEPKAEDIEGFRVYTERFKAAVQAEIALDGALKD